MPKTIIRASNLSLLPPTSDFVFCNLFGVKENTDCLMSLLNSILRGNPVVYDLKLRPTEHKKILDDGKGIRADVLADINDSNAIVNVEMQCSDLDNSLDRMLFYQAMHRVRSINAGSDYKIMPHIISIWILTGSMYQDLDDCTHEIKMALHTSDGVYIRTASEKERIIIIELDKLPRYIEKLKQEQYAKLSKQTQNTDGMQVHLDHFSTWMTFLSNPLNLPEKCNDIDTIHKAFDKLRGMSSDPDIRAEYNQAMREKSERTANYNRGKEEGLEEGIEIGREEGAKKKAIETAKNFLSMGLSIEQVVQGTGLTREDVEAINNS